LIYLLKLLCLKTNQKLITMKKIIVPGLVASFANLAAAMLFGYAFMFIIPSLETDYSNTQIFRPWSDPLMNLYYLYPFLISFGLAWAWEKSKSLFTKTYLINAFNFTLIYWLISSIPGMVMSISSFKISVVMVLTWTISAFIQVFVVALIVGGMNKK
jgi:hypothetical protein